MQMTLFGLLAAAPREHDAGDDKGADPGPAGELAEVVAGNTSREQSQDRHPGLEGGEDQGHAEPVPWFEATDPERRGESKGVEGQGEEDPRGRTDGRHAGSLTGGLAHRTPVWYDRDANMRTLATQVKLRRLIRAFGEARARLGSEPLGLQVAGSLVDRLLDLSGEVRDSLEGLPRPLDRYFKASLRTIDLAIAGLGQAGADLELLQSDFDQAALPLEVFLRGLDAEPALQRSA